jgi:hypothetical protein
MLIVAQRPPCANQKFCRFHNCCGPIEVDVSTSADVPAAPCSLPVLEDATSIQLAIAQVCEHLLHRRLDAKQAGILLYAMQVASSNLGRLNEDKSQKKSEENNRENSVEASSAAPPVVRGYFDWPGRFRLHLVRRT